MGEGEGGEERGRRVKGRIEKWKERREDVDLGGGKRNGKRERREGRREGDSRRREGGRG